jgi:hypothetical protein
VADYEDVVAPSDAGERLQLWPLLQAILGRLPLLLKAKFPGAEMLDEPSAAYLLHAAVRIALRLPAHEAEVADNPSPESLEFLLREGVDADSRVLGSTALGYTVTKGSEPQASAIVAMLLKYGANPSQDIYDNSTGNDVPAIKMAASNQLSKTVNLLVKEGVDPLRTFDDHDLI